MIGQFGLVLGPHQWVIDLSPFTHLPRIPGGTFTATPILCLITVCAALTAAGMVGFQRRDLN